MPSFLHNCLGSDDTPIAKWLSSQPLIHGWMPLSKDLMSGHSWSTYWKHAIQFHTYSYFLNLWILDVTQMWLLGSATIWLIDSMTRSHSGSRFPEDSHKALASVLFSSISMPENSHRNVVRIHFNLLMIPRWRQQILLEVVTSILTASFNATKEFCQSHGLIINPAKTQLIIFKAVGERIPDDFHLMLDNCSISPQTTVKLLGVTLDQHLNILPSTLRLIMWLASAMDCLEPWPKLLHIFLNSYSSWHILHWSVLI